MAFSFAQLSLSGIQAAAGASILPPGRYVCKVSGAKVEDTKAGTGKVLKIRLSCDKGLISDNINIYNRSEEATRIVRIPLMADTHSTPIADSVPPMADTWYKCPE